MQDDREKRSQSPQGGPLTGGKITDRPWVNPDVPVTDDSSPVAPQATPPPEEKTDKD